MKQSKFALVHLLSAWACMQARAEEAMSMSMPNSKFEFNKLDIPPSLEIVAPTPPTSSPSTGSPTKAAKNPEGSTKTVGASNTVTQFMFDMEITGGNDPGGTPRDDKGGKARKRARRQNARTLQASSMSMSSPALIRSEFGRFQIPQVPTEMSIATTSDSTTAANIVSPTPPTTSSSIPTGSPTIDKAAMDMSIAAISDYVKDEDGTSKKSRKRKRKKRDRKNKRGQKGAIVSPTPPTTTTMPIPTGSPTKAGKNPAVGAVSSNDISQFAFDSGLLESNTKENGSTTEKKKREKEAKEPKERKEKREKEDKKGTKATRRKLL